MAWSILINFMQIKNNFHKNEQFQILNNNYNNQHKMKYLGTYLGSTYDSVVPVLTSML